MYTNPRSAKVTFHVDFGAPPPTCTCCSSPASPCGGAVPRRSLQSTTGTLYVECYEYNLMSYGPRCGLDKWVPWFAAPVRRSNSYFTFNDVQLYSSNEIITERNVCRSNLSQNLCTFLHVPVGFILFRGIPRGIPIRTVPVGVLLSNR